MGLLTPAWLAGNFIGVLDKKKMAWASDRIPIKKTSRVRHENYLPCISLAPSSCINEIMCNCLTEYEARYFFVSTSALVWKHNTMIVCCVPENAGQVFSAFYLICKAIGIDSKFHMDIASSPTSTQSMFRSSSLQSFYYPWLCGEN
jgi:hypothetical protein